MCPLRTLAASWCFLLQLTWFCGTTIPTNPNQECWGSQVSTTWTGSPAPSLIRYEALCLQNLKTVLGQNGSDGLSKGRQAGAGAVSLLLCIISKIQPLRFILIVESLLSEKAVITAQNKVIHNTILIQDYGLDGNVRKVRHCYIISSCCWNDAVRNALILHCTG